MADESVTNSLGLNTVPIVVDGLRKTAESDGQKSEKNHIEATHTERILLPENEPLSTLWAQIKSLGYDSPDWLQRGEKSRRYEHERKNCIHPFEELEVVQGRPSESGKCINLEDPLIEFANRQFRREVNLNIGESDSADYGTPLESLKDDHGLVISFHRTIRMPDDDKLHQLPGSLGAFPLFSVNAYKDQLPDTIVQQGGVFLPMWQREALWISFTAPSTKKYALRVFVGRINAVSGLKMDERTEEAQATELLQDYIVVPGQNWLDGICVAPGIVRQFVAMPLGSGYTVEGQKTGEEKFGGLQIEIVPALEPRLRTWLPESTGRYTMPATFEFWKSILDEQKTPSQLKLNPGAKIRSYPSPPTFSAPCQISDLAGTAPKEDIRVRALYEESHMSSLLSGLYGCGQSAFTTCPPLSLDDADDAESAGTKGSEDLPTVKVPTKDLKAMGLAAGGKLVQDIYRDPHPARIWNVEATRLVNVHILDPASCEKVTHIVPPPPPIDATSYVEAKMPFFVVEEQAHNRVEGGDFNNVNSVSTIDKEKGVTTGPEFDPSKPKMCKECETRLCDCIIRPCNHQFCNVCIKKLEHDPAGRELSVSSQHLAQQQQQEVNRRWKCPTCTRDVSHVAGFSAPMNLPGEEALKVRVPVHVLKIEDGRVQFRSIQTTRI